MLEISLPLFFLLFLTYNYLWSQFISQWKFPSYVIVYFLLDLIFCDVWHEANMINKTLLEKEKLIQNTILY